jgi:hypothetical protein
MEARPAIKGCEQSRSVENLRPRLVYNHGVCSGNFDIGHKIFRCGLRRCKRLLDSNVGEIQMRFLKSLPYVFVGCLSMTFVSFTTMSVIVLRDIAESRGETVGTINAYLSIPIKDLGNIPVKI